MKQSSPLQFVGASPINRESIAKSRGDAIYIEDLRLPSMLYGGVVRCPHHHARVLSTNGEAVRAMEGVRAVATFRDLEEGTTGGLYNCAGSPPSPFVLWDEQILTDHPRFCGDRVAALAAVSPRALEAAIDAFQVKYHVLPYVQELRDATAPDAPRLHDDAPGNIAKEMEVHVGDCDAAFARAAHVHRSRYRTRLQQAAPMETSGCVCDFRDGALTVWSNTQTPHQDKRVLAQLFGLPISRVRCVQPVIGGGFGSRQQMHEQPVAALLSRMAGRPVQMIHSRQEEFLSAVRHPSEIQVKTAFDDAGRIEALEIDVRLNTGGYAGHGPVVMAAMRGRMNYDIPNYRYRGLTVYSNLPSAGALRGYGNPQLTFARESHLDEVAEILGMDPIRLRLKNHLRKGGHIPGVSWPVESCGIEECARTAAESVGKIQSRIDRQPPNPGQKEGWGSAFCMHGSGIADRDMSSAVVLMNDDGSFQLLTGAVEMGQGAVQTLAQITAEELGIARLEDLQVVMSDTAVTPYDVGAFSSRQIYVCGRAARDAAAQAREKLLREASKCAAVFPHGVDPAALELRDGVLWRDGTRVCKLRELAAALSFGEGSKAVLGLSTYKPGSSPPPFAVCFAHVQVNAATGRVHVPHIVLSADVGRAIHPAIVESQIQGGVLMGLGYAVDEEVFVDRPTGELKNTGFLHYALPVINDPVNIVSRIVESHEPTGPYGAKSVGELPLIPVAAAIANGFYAATGVRIRELPLTPERVLKHLGAAKGGDE